MTDSEFASPKTSSTAHANPPLPSVVKGIAIAAIVLGVIGLGQGLLGLMTTVSADAIAEALIPSLPSSAREPYRALMAAQTSLMGLALVTGAISLLASIFMAGSGIMSLAGRKVGTLGFAALGAAGADVLNLLVQIFMRVWTSAEWDAYNASISGTPGAQGGQIGGMVGLIIGYFVLLAFAGFWVWAYTAVSKTVET